MDSSPVNTMGDEIRTEIGARLREERLRLELSQAELAAVGYVSKRSVLEWEKGSLVPTAEFLARIAPCGFDVLYVVVGQRESRSPIRDFALQQGEPEMILQFRLIPEKIKPIVSALIASSSKLAVE